MSIDGVGVGKWRLEAGQIADIEHPVGDAGRFTFFALETKAAKAAKIATNTEAGLVSAKFFTEIIPLRALEAPQALHARRRLTDETLSSSRFNRNTSRLEGRDCLETATQLYRRCALTFETSDEPECDDQFAVGGEKERRPSRTRAR